MTRIPALSLFMLRLPSQQSRLSAQPLLPTKPDEVRFGSTRHHQVTSEPFVELFKPRTYLGMVDKRPRYQEKTSAEYREDNERAVIALARQLDVQPDATEVANLIQERNYCTGADVGREYGIATALEIRKKHFGEDSVPVATTRYTLGKYYYDHQDKTSPEVVRPAYRHYLERAADVLEATGADVHTHTVLDARQKLATSYLTQLIGKEWDRFSVDNVRFNFISDQGALADIATRTEIQIKKALQLSRKHYGLGAPAMIPFLKLLVTLNQALGEPSKIEQAQRTLDYAAAHFEANQSRKKQELRDAKLTDARAKLHAIQDQTGVRGEAFFNLPAQNQD